MFYLSSIFFCSFLQYFVLYLYTFGWRPEFAVPWAHSVCKSSVVPAQELILPRTFVVASAGHFPKIENSNVFGVWSIHNCSACLVAMQLWMMLLVV